MATTTETTPVLTRRARAEPRGAAVVRPGVRRSLLRAKLARQPALLPGWPLVVLLAGFPLWWILGLATLGFLIVAVPMAYYLIRLPVIRVPRGFGLWLLFLGWVAAGITTLWAEAPGAKDVAGLGRLIPFTYRIVWYLTATIFLLYIGNTSERTLPTRRIVRLMAWLFIITVIGGYAGKFLPTLEFTSLVERVLPGALANNQLVQIVAHPATAQVQDILGYDVARPMAPFSYANDWGANFGLLAPFFVLAWRVNDTGWRHKLFPAMALIALPPVIFTLNRGLWLGLSAVGIYLVIRFALLGRVRTVATLAAIGLLAGIVVIFSPLGQLLNERLANPHSNQGRERLSELAVSATLEGSPALGFGAPREVQGTFFSIAGAPTPNCPECRPPQLGTQGHFWLLIFAHGFVGAALFLGFVYYRFWRGLRDPTPAGLALTSIGVFLAVVGVVYDLVSASLAFVMITLGLLWRRENEMAEAPTARPVALSTRTGSERGAL
ncbi:MAG: hypothetical protein L0Y54_21755 [Sporichthyaceae bacterium]|nr:hypothetical protein [Sporichthyaceae bacterium]